MVPLFLRAFRAHLKRRFLILFLAGLAIVHGLVFISLIKWRVPFVYWFPIFIVSSPLALGQRTASMASFDWSTYRRVSKTIADQYEHVWLILMRLYISLRLALRQRVLEVRLSCPQFGSHEHAGGFSPVGVERGEGGSSLLIPRRQKSTLATQT